MTAIRVVMVAPTPFFSDRGCHVRILEEARALQRAGAEVTVCTYFLGDTPSGVDVRRGRRFPGYTKRSAGPSWTKPFMDLDLLALVRRVVKEKNPHVIHGHLHEGMAIGALAGGSALRALDYQGSLSQELEDHGWPRWLAAGVRPLERWIDHRAHTVFTSHEKAVHDLESLFGVPRDRIVNTMDAGSLPAAHPERVEALKREWNLRDGQTVILYTGLLGKHQGTPLLLDLAGEIKTFKDIDAVVLACGYPEEAWAREAERRGLDSVLRFTGRFSYKDYPHILALGDVAVSPKTSVTEGNQKLYAYLQAGLPTVTFDSSINRAIMEEAALYVPPDDFEGFVKAVLQLVKNPTRQKELTRRAREVAQTKGTWDTVAQRILEAYTPSTKIMLPVEAP